MKFKSISIEYICSECGNGSSVSKYGMVYFSIDKIHKEIEEKYCYKCSSVKAMNISHIDCEVDARSKRNPPITVEWCFKWHCRTCKMQWKAYESMEEYDMWDSLILEHIQASTTCPNDLCKNSDVKLVSFGTK